jgi:Zeta toxin
MSQQFARMLLRQPQIKEFLEITLGVNMDDFPKIEYEIIKSEKGVVDGLENPTSTSIEFRDRNFSTDADRLLLRKQIVNELFTKNLLKDDDKISPSRGGARPKKIKYTKQAYFLMGLPASGKSSVAFEIANRYGAVILDSDFAKRKLPEYPNYPWGASIVHEESSMIVFGNEEKTGFTSLYSMAIQDKCNVVIPKIGADYRDIIPYCEALKKAGYSVHLTLVYLPKEKATIRALKRFHDTKRYVPLARIFDVYANNPALTYFLLKNKKPRCIDTYGIINTDVGKRERYLCTDLIKNNPAKHFKIQKTSLI